MEYVPLGNTGLFVSRFCFGAMTFGETNQKNFAWLGNEGQEAANKMVATSLDAGINFFDTANAYGVGTSERMLGKSLEGKREDVIIATKVYLPMSSDINGMGNSRYAIMREVENSLKRLNTDRIDLYQLHKWDETTPIEETLRALDDCVRQGKVRYIGLSNSAAWQIVKADGVAQRLGTERFCSLQAYYSLVGRDLEWDILPAIKDLGMGTMIYSPLAAGFLSGKYSGEGTAEGRRSAMNYPPVDMEQGDKVVGVLREIGDAHGRSPSQVAIAWLLHQEGVTSVIIGARKQHQLEDNLAAIDLNLSDDELNQLNKVSARAPIYPHFMPDMPRGVDMDKIVSDSDNVS